MATYYVLTSGGSDLAAGTSVGAGWATISKAVATVAAGDTVYLCTMVAGEEHNLTAGVTISTVGGINTPIIWSGANASGVHDGTLAIIDLQSNAITITVSATSNIFRSIEVKGSSTTHGWTITGGRNIWLDCSARNNAGSGYGLSVSNNLFVQCLASGNTAEGWNNSGTQTCWACVGHNNTGSGFRGDGMQCYYCIADTNGGRGFRNIYAVHNSIAYNNSSNGIDAMTNKSGTFINNILVSNGATGIVGSSDEAIILMNNAFFGNVTAQTSGVAGLEIGSITLSGDPFVNSAGEDFSLNRNSNAGLQCMEAGIPDTWRSGNSTSPTTLSYVDLGAAPFRRRSVIVS